MSYVGSAVVGQRLDQPIKFQYTQEVPKQEYLNEDEETNDEENVFPKPLEFEKKSEKIDYFDAIKGLHQANYQNTLPKPLQPTKQNKSYSKPTFQARKPKYDNSNNNNVYTNQKDKKQAQKQVQQQKQQQIKGQKRQSYLPQNNKKIDQSNVINEEYEIESQTESHACTNCICHCFEDENFDINSVGDSQSCVCTDCGNMHAQVEMEIQKEGGVKLENDDEFAWPDKFDREQRQNQQQQEVQIFEYEQQKQDVQQIHQSQNYQGYNNKQIVPNKNYNQNTQESRYSTQQKKPNYSNNQSRIQGSLSPTPPKTAPLQRQIDHQQKKVAHIQNSIQNQKQQTQQQKQNKGINNYGKTDSVKEKKIPQKNNYGNQRQQSPPIKQNKKETSHRKEMDDVDKLLKQNINGQEDDERPNRYDGINPQKIPRLERTNISAKEIAIRNNIVFKQKKFEEEQQKLYEKEQKQRVRQNAKQYSQQVKNQNKGKIMKQKEIVEDHKWAWGADQQLLQEDKKAPEKEECLAKKPECVARYNEVSQFFDSVPSNWLNKIQERVQNELKEIKRPKSLPRRNSVENKEQQQQLPFKYLRSKSTAANKEDQNRFGEQDQRIQQREQAAQQKLLLEPKQQKQREKSKKKLKLQQIDEKSKIILQNTKMVKFVTEDEQKLQEERKALGEDFMGEQGKYSLTRFNLKSQQQKQGQNYEDREDGEEQQQEQYGGNDYNGLENDRNALQYDNYKKKLKNTYDDSFEPQNSLKKVFGQDVDQSNNNRQGSAQANKRLAIGFQSKHEQQDPKQKDSGRLINWSKAKEDREKIVKSQIIAEEKYSKLKEERQIRKEEKRRETEEKRKQAKDFDDYGYNKKTGEYDVFFDKYKNSNFLEQNDNQIDESDMEYENQMNVQMKQLNSLNSQLQKQDEFVNSNSKQQHHHQQQQQFQESGNKYYNPNTENYQFQPQGAQFEQVLSDKQYQQFLQKQTNQQMQIQQIASNSAVNYKQIQPYTNEENQIRGQLKFMDKKGNELPPNFVKQMFNEGQLQDLPGNTKSQKYGKGEQLEDYYKEVEEEIKKSMWTKKNQQNIKQSSKFKSKKQNQSSQPPLELRKRAEQEKAQMEVDRLRVPNLDDIMRDTSGAMQGGYSNNNNADYMLGNDLPDDNRAEDWGELDGIQLKGTKPYWEDMKVKAKQDAYDLDSDSDIYIKEKSRGSRNKINKNPEDMEVLERIEYFNDIQIQRNLKSGGHKRIPFDDKAGISVYSERCKNEKQQQQDYRERAGEFQKQNNKFDDSDDELAGGGFSKHMYLNFEKRTDKIFDLDSNKMLQLDHFDIQ